MPSPNELVLLNKNNSIKNLAYLLNSISGNRRLINYSDVHEKNLTLIMNKISNPVTEFITQAEIDSIDKAATEFISPDFCKRIFRNKDLSSKLQQLWNILDELYTVSPGSIVECVTHMIEKKIPKKLSESDKLEFWTTSLTKFIGTSQRVNTVTDLIFADVRKDFQSHTLDVLTICGLLISFVVNSQSHLYFSMENLKKTVSSLDKNYDIEDLFSIESKVIQNNEIVTDIQAIRNAVSHGSFNIEYNYTEREYIIDFQNVLPGYRFNRKYTSNQFLDLYADYDKLRNFQELLIRIVFLKATIKNLSEKSCCSVSNICTGKMQHSYVVL